MNHALQSHQLRPCLSFGGVPSTLRIPLAAITAFADPHARHGMRFRSDARTDITAPAIAEAPTPEASVPDVVTPEPHQVVSLDAFRRRPTPKT